jgi:esterase/lipase superfamily enzyme
MRFGQFVPFDLRWALLLGIYSAFCLCNLERCAYGATLLDCQLVMDGGAVPPGDRIDCSLHLLPQDKRVSVQARAYTLEREEKLEPIEATGKGNRDPRGRFRIVVHIAHNKPNADCSILIPYADLAIPIGTHRLVYEITLEVAGKTVWTQYSPVTRVKITGNARNRLSPEVVGRQAAFRNESFKAHVSSAMNVMSNRQLLVEEVRNSPASVVISSSIDRGFERSRIEEGPTVHERVRGLDNQAWNSLSDVANPNERTVYFATNRLMEPDGKVSEGESWKRFGVEISDELVLGSCTVNFPIRHHRRGALETASRFARPDPEKHFLIEALKQLTRDELLEPLGNHDLLLFVHGFNNRFDDAVLRAGQIQYDAEFPGEVCAFSWPSLGLMSTDDYKADIAKAEKSVLALSELLELLTVPKDGRGIPRKVHVVAHSLGNRLLLASLYDLVKRGIWKSDEQYLGQVVLAAPDVGALKFNNLVGFATKCAKRVSYYYCRSDMALKISQTINNYEPVGLYPFFQDKLDTINADGVDTSFIGHGYYGSSAKVLADFNLLFRYNYSPSQRMPPLFSHSRIYDHDHWSFLPVEIREQ